MVVEMVGARKFSQVDPRLVKNYFPDKIYEDMMVFQENKLEEIMIMCEDEHETTRKMFLVHSDKSIGWAIND